MGWPVMQKTLLKLSRCEPGPYPAGSPAEDLVSMENSRGQDAPGRMYVKLEMVGIE